MKSSITFFALNGFAGQLANQRGTPTINVP